MPEAHAKALAAAGKEEGQPECSCAMTESSFHACPVHGAHAPAEEQ